MIKFETMWKNYPDKEKMKLACTNKQPSSNKPFSDYCAIMMSECFIRSSIDIPSFYGNRCWSHSGKKHILLAEDFANSLNIRSPPGFGVMEKINTGSFQESLKGRTGVIFLKITGSVDESLLSTVVVTTLIYGIQTKFQIAQCFIAHLLSFSE